MLPFDDGDRSEPTTLYRYRSAEEVMWAYLEEIPQWWAEEGGRAVSFGIGAHGPESLAANFPEAMAMVEFFGFGPGSRPEDFWTR